MKKNIIIYFYTKHSLIYCVFLIITICTVLFIIQNFTDEYIKA